MGGTSSVPEAGAASLGASAATADAPKKKKICCACPETKAARDACVVSKGEEDKECRQLIEAHKVCLRAEGFNV
jgi:cytochrome c oxidase assembly protein subunit 17